MDKSGPNDLKKRTAEVLPREELRAKRSAKEMSSERLLAILLKTGAPGCDVLELSRRLVAAFGGVGHLVRADFNTLKEQIAAHNRHHPDKRILGIGEAKRMELAAAFELVRREYFAKDDAERVLDVRTAENRCKIFRRVLKPDDRQEKFCVLMLDGKLHPLGDPQVVFQGTQDGTTVHPREVFQAALKWGAHSVMVAHNHPSGDPEPGVLDMALTRRLLAAGSTVGVPLLDHLVLGALGSAGGNGFVSIRARTPDLFRCQEIGNHA